MRTLKAPPPSLNRTLRTPPAHDKILKKSDMKLNDVLINGVRLHCFKVIKSKRTVLSRKNPFEQQSLREFRQEEEEEGDEVTLFKNNAIRRRLKSLDIQPLMNSKNNTDNPNPKKPFVPYHRLSIEIPTINTKIQDPEQLIEPIQLQDLNGKYYTQLKKELMMYSTNNRFNSTSVKRKVQFGKYIGLKCRKQKRYVSEMESSLIQEKIERFDKDIENRQRMTNPINQSLDSPEINTSVTSKNAPANSTQRMKICYSNMFQLREWKNCPDENIDSMQETSRSITSNSASPQ